MIRKYALVIFFLLAIILNNLTGGTTPDFSSAVFPFGPADTPIWQKILVLFLVFTLGFDGLGEELGWRGFALPNLLGRYFPLISSLILGALWAIWHFPYALTRGTFLSEVPLHWFFINLLASRRPGPANLLLHNCHPYLPREHRYFAVPGSFYGCENRGKIVKRGTHAESRMNRPIRSLRA